MVNWKRPFQIFVGYDQPIVYHTFCESVLRYASHPVSFTPLANLPIDRAGESNNFTYSRFLVPYLMGFKGQALYADGDMICRSDIASLFRPEHFYNDVCVVKHDYQTKEQTKFRGAKNENYPRKNWSSLVLWNCEAWPNRLLTPDFVQMAKPEFLHRFQWVKDDRIGELPKEWNWLVGEYEKNDEAKLYHYTLGAPCLNEYADCDHSGLWFENALRVTRAEQ